MKTISTKLLLSDAFRTFGIQDGNWTRDAIDFIADAIKGIGYHIGFEKKITCVTVKNHIGCIPCDAEVVMGVAYKGCKLPLGRDISGYGIVDWRKDNSSTIENPDNVDLTKLLKLYEEQKAEYDAAPVTPTAIREEIQTRIDSTLKKIQTIIQSDRPKMNTSNYADYYNIDLDVIKTSFPDGEIQVLHTALRLDKQGFPLILDEFNYVQAVKFFLLNCLINSGYKHHIHTYETSFNMWELYRRRASNKAKMPSIDAMERFANMWTRYRSEYEFAGQFFVGAEGAAYITD